MSPENHIFDINFFIKISLKYWPLIILLMFLGAGSGYFTSRYLVSPVYQAKTSLFVGLNTDDSGSDAEDIYSGIILGTQLVNDYKEIITSKRVRNQVAEDIRKRKLLDKPLNYAARVVLKRNTRVVVLSIESHDPETAMVVANVTANVFENLAKQIMKLKNVQVIDAAVIPGGSIRPDRKKYTVFGALIGACLMLAAAVLMEILDRTIKNPDQAYEEFHLPVLGSVEEIKQDKILESTNSVDRIGIVALESMRSQIAETFRVLRTTLFYSRLDVERANIIMVTSSLPYEGKSFIVANLAAVTADSGKKVLIIDCDLRKPSLHKTFGVSRGVGLVNYLAGENSFESVLMKDIIDVHVDILPCGPIPPNPTELLASDKFKAMIDMAADKYDYIFLDSPPCMNMADACILGRYADSVLFTVMANSTRIECIRKSIEQLKQVEVNVAGIVLNRFSMKKSGYKYYKNSSNYYYAYNYHYGNQSETDKVKVQKGKAS